jgi:hypothetical protein
LPEGTKQVKPGNVGILVVLWPLIPEQNQIHQPELPGIFREENSFGEILLFFEDLFWRFYFGN